MSAERLAVWRSGGHPAETWASGSAIDYAEKVLFIRCGTAHFFVGTNDGHEGGQVTARTRTVVRQETRAHAVMRTALRCERLGCSDPRER